MKLILKGILLYTTIISVVLFICSIDSLYNNGYFGIAFFVIFIEGLLCYLCISTEDIYKLTYNNPNNMDNKA